MRSQITLPKLPRRIGVQSNDQCDAIEALAERLGVSVDEWFTDPGVSGATVEGRPGFQALLAACERRALPQASAGLVLVLNASRLGRFLDPEEGAYWRHHLRRMGWEVRFAEGDVEGDASSIIRAIAGLEASTYRRNVVANTRRGMKGAADQEFWTREAPFGFRRMVVHPPTSERVLEIGQRKTPDEKVQLTPRDDEAKIVAWMFRTYAAGGE